MVSDFWNEKRQSQAIINYDDLIIDMTEADYSENFAKADAYNDKIRKMPNPFLDYKSIMDEYYRILDVNDDGMMGYLTIEKIEVQLPIYHGTSDKVLNSAVGHIEGTSIPVGGKSTHAALSAHRGLPTAKLFTNLDMVEVGDVFTIRILDRTITYQVDQIRIVLPDETEDLEIVAGEDYCTLVTCTPYAVNTHRLLVRGIRIENTEPERVIRLVTEAYQIDPLIVTPIVATPMLGILLIALILEGKMRKKEKKQKEESVNRHK
jgi:sortase A